MALASVLGADDKKDGYLEGNGYLVSWCLGHLLELAQPEEYGEQYARWNYGDLPILPETWRYRVPKEKKKQLSSLPADERETCGKRGVCHRCRAGGELIFRLVYEYAQCKSRWSVSGFPVWKMMRSGRALHIYGRERIMTGFMMRQCAGQRQIG